MALKKKRENLLGVATEYHKIKRIAIEPWEAEDVEVVYEPTVEELRTHTRRREYRTKPSKGYIVRLDVESYASQKYREDPESTFIDNICVIRKYTPEEFKTLSAQSLYSLAYNILKEEQGFEDSEDC